MEDCKCPQSEYHFTEVYYINKFNDFLKLKYDNINYLKDFKTLTACNLLVTAIDEMIDIYEAQLANLSLLIKAVDEYYQPGVIDVVTREFRFVDLNKSKIILNDLEFDIKLIHELTLMDATEVSNVSLLSTLANKLKHDPLLFDEIITHATENQSYMRDILIKRLDIQYLLT